MYVDVLCIGAYQYVGIYNLYYTWSDISELHVLDIFL